MEEVIRAIAHALRASRVRYVIIGGIAASVWGRPRMTLDVDIVMLVQPERLPDFLKSLVESGFKLAPTAPSRLLRGLPAKLKYGPRLSVDLRIASYTLDTQAIDRAVAVTILGTRLCIASKEDVIAYKVARFEDLDRADIRSIILRHGKKIDTQYLASTCQQLVQETGDEQISRNLDTVRSWL